MRGLHRRLSAVAAAVLRGVVGSVPGGLGPGRAMLVGAVLGGAGPVAAASDGRDGFAEPPAGAAEALCARSGDADPPASDQPTPLQRRSLAGCDGEALLYGIGQAADPFRARLCAFVERDEPDARRNDRVARIRWPAPC